MTDASSAPPPPRPITAPEALVIARKTIEGLKDGADYVILTDKTVDKDFGWVFFYTTKKYLETNDKKHIRPGNGPLVVARADGKTLFLSTSVPPAQGIAELDKRWRDTHKLL